MPPSRYAQRRKLDILQNRLHSSNSELELTRSANTSLKSQLVEIEQLVVHNELKQKLAIPSSNNS